MPYPITYDVTPHDPPLEREEIPDGRGACHAVLITSIVKAPDGSSSYAFVSMDEEGEDIPPLELWKAWLMLATTLKDTLPEGFQKEACSEVFEAAKAVVTATNHPPHCPCGVCRKLKDL